MMVVVVVMMEGEGDDEKERLSRRTPGPSLALSPETPQETFDWSSCWCSARLATPIELDFIPSAPLLPHRTLHLLCQSRALTHGHVCRRVEWGRKKPAWTATQ